MGVNKILSIAGNHDIVAYRNQALTSENSSHKLTRLGVPFGTTIYTAMTFDIYEDPDFQVASPIVSWTKAAGEIVAASNGFSLNTPAADLDVDGKIYYYALRGDSNLLLYGKFVVAEYPETL